MKRLVILMLGLLVIPFLLGLSYSEDPFDEFNSSNLSESPKDSSDQSVSHNSSNDRYVVIDKQFWNGNYSKVITVESFEKSFPPSAFPLHTDFFIKFDDQVINSFSDHMVSNNVPLIYDMLYSLCEDKLRVTTLFKYSELTMPIRANKFNKIGS
mgnify:FL=1